MQLLSAIFHNLRSAQYISYLDYPLNLHAHIPTDIFYPIYSFEYYGLATLWGCKIKQVLLLC
jgi:hypothetical protein